MNYDYYTLKYLKWLLWKQKPKTKNEDILYLIMNK